MTTITRRTLTGNVRTYQPLNKEEGELIVWSYGGITKNLQAMSVPKTVVFFRKLDSQGVPGSSVRKKIALTHLGLLRIGTIWQNGVCRAETILETDKFDVDFTHRSWRFVSPYECARNGQPAPIDQADYPLHFAQDKNWLLDFPLADGKNLLIPCLEFFVRCYGRSEEVPRDLATYPWDEVERRFCAPFDQPVIPGIWPVKLKKRMRNGDTVFIAHAKHDPYAQRVAKSIYGQIVTALGNKDTHVFAKIAPWFQGPAQIKVSGLRINDGKTFLALRILGCSDPQGESIQRDRENTNKTDAQAEGAEGGKSWDGAPVRVPKKLLDIVDLTDDQEPDHGASTLEVEEDDFEVLGTPRVVIDVRRDRAKTSAGRPGESGEPGVFSTGDPYGSGKGAGYASIHARPVMESQGMLRDMWNAMRYLKESQPDLIRSAEWFTFDRGFRSTPEPELIALQPFDDDSAVDMPTETRNWLYRDVALKRPRGILVTRVMALESPVYIVEIQRRPRKKKDENGNLRDTEETFKGLVFVLDDEKQLDSWLRQLLSEIRHVRGIVQKLIGKCPGRADAFKHTSASDEKVPCEAAVLNALGKVGVKA
ncbi:MAG: hypothetical protein Q8J72_07945 [Rhodocyclaceae bacterium]|nr:hypothetical protein [Rhodocyclaceae bacterium]